MYSYASGYLRSRKYEHYEISSYAYRSDNATHRSKHNQIYWQIGGQWRAVGLGATNNVNGVRFARPPALSDYIKWTQGLKQNFIDSLPSQNTGDTRKPPWLYKEPKANDDLTDEDDTILDVVMTRLRTSEGLDLEWTGWLIMTNMAKVTLTLK